MGARRSRTTRAGLAVSFAGVLLLGAACGDDEGVDAGIGESEFTELEEEVGAFDDRMTEMEDRIGVLEDEVGVAP